jgi:hypothetical protein
MTGHDYSKERAGRPDDCAQHFRLAACCLDLTLTAPRGHHLLPHVYPVHSLRCLMRTREERSKRSDRDGGQAAMARPRLTE